MIVKTKNSIVRSKNRIVNNLKTLAVLGLYGLTQAQSKNPIVQSKNQIIGTKNPIVSLITHCFYLKNQPRKNLKELKDI